MLAKTLKEDFSSHRFILVLGVLKEKDIKTMVSTIALLSDVIIVTKSANTRASDPLFLKETIERFDAHKKIYVEASIPEAIDHAKRIAKQNDLICVSGSLFTVGEARSYILSGKMST